MALEPYQLYPNAPINIGGSDGTVVTSDASLTSVAREDGSIDWYESGYVADEGSVPAPPAPEDTQTPATVVSDPNVQAQSPAPVATTPTPTDNTQATDTQNTDTVTPDESTTPVTSAVDSGSRQETS